MNSFFSGPPQLGAVSQLIGAERPCREDPCKGRQRYRRRRPQRPFPWANPQDSARFHFGDERGLSLFRQGATITFDKVKKVSSFRVEVGFWARKRCQHCWGLSVGIPLKLRWAPLPKVNKDHKHNLADSQMISVIIIWTAGEHNHGRSGRWPQWEDGPQWIYTDDAQTGGAIWLLIHPLVYFIASFLGF